MLNGEQKEMHPFGEQRNLRLTTETLCREEDLTSTRESINTIKTALEQGLEEMKSSRSIVTSQLFTMGTGEMNNGQIQLGLLTKCKF